MPADRTHVPESAIKNKNNFPTEQEEGAQAQYPEGTVREGQREVATVCLREVTPGYPPEGEGGSVAVNKQEQKGLEA